MKLMVGNSLLVLFIDPTSHYSPTEKKGKGGGARGVTARGGVQQQQYVLVRVLEAIIIILTRVG